MEKDSEKLSWNDNSSFFHCLFKFGKDKKGYRESKNVFMILLILATYIIGWFTVSIEKEPSLPSE